MERVGVGVLEREGQEEEEGVEPVLGVMPALAVPCERGPLAPPSTAFAIVEFRCQCGNDSKILTPECFFFGFSKPASTQHPTALSVLSVLQRHAIPG